MSRGKGWGSVVWWDGYIHRNSDIHIYMSVGMYPFMQEAMNGEIAPIIKKPQKCSFIAFSPCNLLRVKDYLGLWIYQVRKFIHPDIVTDNRTNFGKRF